MKSSLLKGGLLLVFVVSACSRTSTAPSNSASPSNSQDAKAELRLQIEKIASLAKGRVGAGAVVLETGESFYLNGRERFPMQSVYKLPIGMAVLSQVDKGLIKLDQRIQVSKSDFVGPDQYSPLRDRNPNGTQLTVSQLLQFMVSQSDGTACDVLLKLVGIEWVRKYLNELKVDNVVVANTEKEIGSDWQIQYDNWTSPEGMIGLLRALYESRRLSAESQALILKLMSETAIGPKRLKGGLPEGTPLAHKTGTSSTRNGLTAATNDVGLITLPNGRHIAIAVFVADSTADTATREQVISNIAKTVWNEWSK